MQSRQIRLLFSTLQKKQVEGNLNYYKNLRVYKHSSILCLFNRLLNYQLISSNFLVKHFHHVYSNFLGRQLTNQYIKFSINPILVGGQTTEEVGEFVNKQSTHSIVSYVGIEGQDEFILDLNAKIFLKSIAHTNPKRPIIALKISSLKTAEQIKINALIQQKINEIWDKIKDQKNETTTSDKVKQYLLLNYRSLSEEDVEEFLNVILRDLSVINEVDWKTLVHSYYYVENERNENKVIRMINQHSNQDLSELRNVALRLNKIIQHAQKQNCQVLIDSEDSNLQDDIDSITTQYQIYNKEAPVVFATIQSYLSDSGKKVDLEIRKSKAQDLKLAVKLVRGAYLNYEQQQVNVKVNSSSEQTSQNYDNDAHNLVKNLGQAGSLILATVNEQSIKKVIDQLGAGNRDQVLFAQTLGMGDHLTHSLRLEGYQVAKLVMFGETSQLVGWLSRRAHEHRQGKSIATQQQLILDELYRRSSFYS